MSPFFFRRSPCRRPLPHTHDWPFSAPPAGRWCHWILHSSPSAGRFALAALFPRCLTTPRWTPGGPTHGDAPSATTSMSWSVVAAGSPHLAPRPTTTILATSHPTVHPLNGPVDPTTHPDLMVQVPQGDPTRVLDMAASTPTNAPMPTASSSAVIPPTPGETSDFDSLLL